MKPDFNLEFLMEFSILAKGEVGKKAWKQDKYANQIFKILTKNPQVL